MEVLVVIFSLLLSSIDCLQVCKVEYSDGVHWESDGGLVVSRPACLDEHGKYVVRECRNGTWYPSKPPKCSAIATRSAHCEDPYIEIEGNCVGISPPKRFDDPCPYPGSVKYYNYSWIQASVELWSPIKRKNSSFVYTSIDRKYGREFNVHAANTSKDCFVTIPGDLRQVDCTTFHYHLCLLKEKLLPRLMHGAPKTLRLELRLDQRRDKLYLTVYSPELLLNKTDSEEYAVYCFTDASSDELTSRVKLKLLHDTLRSKKRRFPEEFMVYQIALKYPHPGQYWCEAYNASEALSRSNTVVASKKRKGNEYALRLVLKDFCSNCTYITTADIYRYLERVDFKDVFRHVDFAVRVMMIYGRNGSAVDVLLHVTTLRNANVIGEYYKLLRFLEYTAPPQLGVVYFRSCDICLPVSAGGVNWGLAHMGTVAAPRELCLDASGLPARRQCGGDFLTGAIWAPFNNCSAQVELGETTRELYNLSLAPCEGVASKIKNLTAGDLNPVDVYLVATTISNLTLEPDIVDDMADTFEHILETDGQVLAQSQAQLNATDAILDAIDRILRDEALLDNVTTTPYVIRREQLLVHITKPYLSNVSGMALYGNAEVVDLKLNESFDSLALEDLEVSVLVPPEVLEAIAGESPRENVTVVTAVFNNDKLFNEVGPLNASTTGRVVSVSIPGYGAYLEEPVLVLFRNDEVRDNASSCSFWNYGAISPDRTGRWSSSGGSLVETSNTSYAQCAYNHLTHFALLILSQRLMVEEQDAVSEQREVNFDVHREALDVITIIGCALSFLGIMGIVATAALFRRWRQKAGNKILLQLSVMIALEITVIHAADSGYIFDKTVACNIVGVCLHYVVLSKFSWMLVSAFLQYIRFVKVLAVLPPRLVLKAMAFGWCAPLPPVVAVAALLPNNYSVGAQKFCYPTNLALYLGLFAPVVAIILANIAIFILIMRNVLTSKVEGQPKTKSTHRLQLYLGILLFFMLGMPWLFGILAEITTTSVLQLCFVYLFCLTATLQGAVLFVFYVLMNKDTRTLWRKSFAKQK